MASKANINIPKTFKIVHWAKQQCGFTLQNCSLLRIFREPWIVVIATRKASEVSKEIAILPNYNWRRQDSPQSDCIMFIMIEKFPLLPWLRFTQLLVYPFKYVYCIYLLDYIIGMIDGWHVIKYLHAEQ